MAESNQPGADCKEEDSFRRQRMTTPPSYAGQRSAGQFRQNLDQLFNICIHGNGRDRELALAEIDKQLRRAEELERDPDERPRVGAPRPEIRIMEYDGHTDFEEYLNQFISIVEYAEWTDEEAAVTLMSKLKGEALTVVSSLDDHSLRALTTTLRQHFSVDQKEIAASKLNGRVQQAGETLQSLSIDVQRLVKRAYPEADDEIRDRLAKDSFVNAIGDRNIREKLRDKNPATLSQTLQDACRFSANVNAERTRARMITEVKEEPNSRDEIEDLRQQIKQLSTTFSGERQKKQKKTKPKQKIQTVQLAEEDKGKTGYWKNRSPRTPPTCFRCGKKGHIARWCPFTDAQLKEMKRAETDEVRGN